MLTCRGGDSYAIIRLKENLHKMQDDTAKVRILNSLSEAYYFGEQLDSCIKFNNLSRDLIDNLLRNIEVKTDSAYNRRCQILKAMTIRNSALILEGFNKDDAIDSLNLAMEIIKATGDKDGIALINQSIGWIYEYNSQYDIALEHYQIAKSLFEETGNKKKLGFLLSLIGICQRYTGNYGDALESQMQALKIGEETKDSLTIKETLLALGFTYLKVEKWKEALGYQRKALDFLILMKDSSGVSRAYSDIGVTLYAMDSLDEAIENHMAALAIRKKIREYFSISSSYFYLGSIYNKQSRYQKALESFVKSYEYAVKSGYSMNIVDSRLELGKVYHRLGQNDLAMENYREAYSFSKERKDWIGSLESCEAIGDIYFGEKEYALSITWYKRAVSYAQRKAFNKLTPIHKKLSDVYVIQGSYALAYKHLVLFSQMKDSLLKAENAEKIIILTSRLEFENKQALLNDRHDKLMKIKQSEIERQRLTRNFSLLGMGIIFILALILFVRFVEKKRLNDKLNLTLSNLKETQSQLIHSEKMASLGELTAGVAHEIQNPLNFVKNFSEVSVDMIQDAEKEINKGNVDEVKILIENLKINMERIMEHGNRASSIVNSMLDHSRKGSGQKEKVNINKMVDEYLRLSFHGYRAKDKSFAASFETVFDKSLPELTVVPQDIGRVFLNLINNAFYAVNEKRKKMDETLRKDYKPFVFVTTRKKNGFAEIRIKDNGIGIPAEAMDKIFQPFFTTKPSGQGTGLGLSLSFDIITKGHGGKLKVNSRENEGTEFIIELKIA